MTTITTRDASSVRIPAVPRGARVAAELFVAALRWLFRAPAPRALTRLQEAAKVRQMAFELQDSDPGLAADLYAAAARHESIGER